ncbi:biopolymer transporter ExbD [Longimicrobium terrae]|uniref:Biopolymer transport protein ExbD/biopolymer transport protein TolR n=1 Tax=Longimicrobium terrae TaxID=1639882 RepID=A0A841GWD2_9BACT|nr:biopolymer transporter ExbD [Longimicrobium terrae]MBB4634584.1 biopolymer transport protein ExbD [Longimicrobium terrae]MBB6068526.1 biopolymer transport protein ExbD/biopolymer transport protein TolR [Longimicrobium terrae]NNC27716.1 biopolymer transporter ExbD [Longimicrobium terrae]
MPRRRDRKELGYSAEINVTSLVDVVLTLLVIFMITAPMMQGGVEVKVPRAQTQSVPSSEGLIVTVDRAGQVYIGEAAVRMEEFAVQFPAIVKERGASSVYLKADEAVPYGRVVQVLGMMKASDVATVGLVAEEETGN